jgi:hypothetical protein
VKTINLPTINIKLPDKSNENVSNQNECSELPIINLS